MFLCLLPTACWDIGFEPLSHENEQEEVSKVSEWVLLASDPRTTQRSSHSRSGCRTRGSWLQVPSARLNKQPLSLLSRQGRQSVAHSSKTHTTPPPQHTLLPRSGFNKDIVQGPNSQIVLPDLMIKVNPSSEMWENVPTLFAEILLRVSKNTACNVIFFLRSLQQAHLCFHCTQSRLQRSD